VQQQDRDPELPAVPALVRQARSQAGGLRVGGSADVAADDAQAGADDFRDPPRDAGAPGRRPGARQGERDDGEQGGVVGRRLAGRGTEGVPGHPSLRRRDEKFAPAATGRRAATRAASGGA
jgi:hypothetical protein